MARRGAPAPEVLTCRHRRHRGIVVPRVRAFRRLVRERGYPRPLVNRQTGAHRVDCRWPGPPLTVELNGFRFHRSRLAWEADMERERAARGRGEDFRRFTWRDVCEDAGYLLASLDALLLRR